LNVEKTSYFERRKNIITRMSKNTLSPECQKIHRYLNVKN
jgi:hypothetical protein